MLFTSKVLRSARTRQTFAAIIASTSLMMFGITTGWMVPTVEKLLSDKPLLNLTSSEVSWIMSGGLLGAVVSPIPSGVLSDWLGRRNTLRLLITVLLTSWLLTYYATNFSTLFIARCLGGTWGGTSITVAPMYVGEIVEPKFRSFLLNFLNGMMFVGQVVVFIIGNYISYWGLAIFGFSCSLIYCCTLLFIPESPYYYTMKKQRKKAVKSLKWLRGDQNVDEELNEIEKFIEDELKSCKKITDVFSNAGHIKAFIIVVLMTIFIRTSGTNLLTILPIIIPESSFFSITNNNCVTVVGIVYLLGNFRLTCMGMKTLLIVSGMGSGIFMTIMAVWAYIQNSNEFVKYNLSWVPFICFVSHAAFCSFGMCPVGFSLKGEIFPTEHKAIFSAITTILGNTSGFVVLKSFLGIREMFGDHVNFIIASAACYSIVLLTYFAVLETDGKSLQEIQKELNAATETDLKSGSVKRIILEKNINKFTELLNIFPFTAVGRQKPELST